jgi:hypothetical protein
MIITKQIAENFLREPYPDGLNCFTSIEDAAAEVLAQLAPSNYFLALDTPP